MKSEISVITLKWLFQRVLKSRTDERKLKFDNIIRPIGVGSAINRIKK